MADLDRRYFVTTEESGTVDLSEDIGSFKVLYEPWEDIWHGFKNGEPYQREIERPAGVYLPAKEVRGGTMVQNDHELLREAVEEITEVARRVAKTGWEVYGAGKNHDNTIQVFSETPETDTGGPAHFDGDRFLGAGPFRGCTIMGLPLKWWDHAEEVPTIEAPDLDGSNG